VSISRPIREDTLLVDEISEEFLESPDELVVPDEPVVVEVGDADVTRVACNVNHL
jgi:hypothetical protein